MISCDKDKHEHDREAVASMVSDATEAEGHIRARLGKYGLGKLFEAGVEARGIERVPESERLDKRSTSLLFFWFSVNIVLTTPTIGMLAQPVFTLTFPHAVAVVIGFGSMGSAVVAFLATLGPRFGMRTMVITRYSYGYWGSTIVCILNLLTLIGYAVIGVILAGQVLHNVNPKMPLVIGVIIIGGNKIYLNTLSPWNNTMARLKVLICFVGYDFLHHYERYAWIVISIIIIIIYALGGRQGYRPSLQNAIEDFPDHLRAADILSFGSIVFSSTASWATVAADFNCRLPAHTSPFKVFSLTFFGVLLSTLFTTLLGAALMTVPAYAEAYESGDAAKVFSKVFEPWGHGGDFILVLLAFSIVGNIIPDTYSAGLTMQTLVPSLRRIPRAIFTILAFVIYTVAGVAGREHFSAILKNFLAVLGYWVTFWFMILIEEHFIFRRKDGSLRGYNMQIYDSPELLPVGLAAVFASLCGVAGAIIAMAQVWYVGPIAAKLGPSGGNMGFEFAAILTGVVYPPLRWLEIWTWGR